MTDNVNHPKHYTQGGVECIDALAAATINLQGLDAVCTAPELMMEVPFTELIYNAAGTICLALVIVLALRLVLKGENENE